MFDEYERRGSILEVQNLPSKHKVINLVLSTGSMGVENA